MGIKTRGLSPDVFSFSSAMSACDRAGEWQVNHTTLCAMSQHWSGKAMHHSSLDLCCPSYVMFYSGVGGLFPATSLRTFSQPGFAFDAGDLET